MQASSLSLGRALVILAVAAAIACSWVPSIQHLADAQVDAGLKRALVAFAAAKTLNAAVSVVQGTELAFQPVGVGVTLTVGQALDPINDLVEQFASLMLTASVAFGVQKALLAIGAHWLISAAVTALGFVWALLWWRGSAPVWLARALLVLVMIRFAMPVIAIGSDWGFRHFLAPQYQDATKSIDTVIGQVGESVPPVPVSGKSKGWLEDLRDIFSSPGLPWKDRIKELREATDKLADHIVRLMVVFVMQTLVLPLVFLWALLKVASGVVLSRGVAGVPRLAA